MTRSVLPHARMTAQSLAMGLIGVWEPQGGDLEPDTGLLRNGQPNPPLTGGTANMRPAYKAYRYRSRRS